MLEGRAEINWRPTLHSSHGICPVLTKLIEQNVFGFDVAMSNTNIVDKRLAEKKVGKTSLKLRKPTVCIARFSHPLLTTADRS